MAKLWGSGSPGLALVVWAVGGLFALADSGMVCLAIARRTPASFSRAMLETTLVVFAGLAPIAGNLRIRRRVYRILHNTDYVVQCCVCFGSIRNEGPTIKTQ